MSSSNLKPWSGRGSYHQQRTRRQYNDYYHNNQNQNYHNNNYHNNQHYNNQHYNNNQHYHNNNQGNNNGMYQQHHNRGGYRGYSDSYNNYRRHNNNNNVSPVTTPEYEENLPWPAKRSNWSHGTGDSYAFGGNNSLDYVPRVCDSPNSRNCSPDASPICTANVTPISSPEVEESLPWPAKRSNWSQMTGAGDNYSFGGNNNSIEDVTQSCDSPPNSRHGSPDAILNEKPFSFVVESAFTPLDTAIWAKFMEHQQTGDTFRKKVELWRDVDRLVRYMNFTPDFKYDPRNFPFFGLQVVGSTMSGFGSNTSDVDMCLVIRDTEVDQRMEAVGLLQALSQKLSTLPCIENVEMIYAKVPILKFRDTTRRLDVDLNCNNFVGIRNTHLLYAYAQMDWRLQPLVLIVKLWAQFHGINDAKMMTMSSYTLVLMVIHFLQHGLEEPVLMNLHKEYPEKFNNNVPILTLRIHEAMPPWESKNTMGLGELMIHFLEYYARKFDYTRNVISVRTGGTIPIRTAANCKSPKNDFHSWKLLCVEEPFDRTNTARSVYNRMIFERIITIFYTSWQRLLVSQVLDSIFTPFSDEDLRQFSNAVASRLR